MFPRGGVENRSEDEPTVALESEPLCDGKRMRTTAARQVWNNNITNRKKLWDVFIAKKRLTVSEFKEHSEFKQKGIAGFLLFLTKNQLATREGLAFILNEEKVPLIREYLGG